MPRWKRRFEQFRIASGLSTEGGQKQVSTLLYCMGEDAEDTLLSTGITSDEKKRYQTVVDKFDAFFKVRRNVIFERAKFNRRVQEENETIEQFITSLYSLAETCDYGNLTEEMIRDRIVVGIRDHALSERLQTVTDLTLEKAKTAVRQRAAVQEQQRVLKGVANETAPLESLRTRDTGRQDHKASHRTSSSGKLAGKTSGASVKCGRCGRNPHPRSQCPASEVVCHKCGKKGHFQSHCFSKTISDLTEEVLQPTNSDDDLFDPLFLNAIGGSSKCWMTEITANGVKTQFKIDTGAEVTAVSKETFHKLQLGTLAAAQKVLCGLDRRPLHTCGQVTCTLGHKEMTSKQQVYVLKGIQNNLLGLPAIKALHLVVQADSIAQPVGRTTDCQIPDQFPSLFEGLGNFQREYTIKMKDDAKPFALFTPRNVPLPLRKKVKAELQCIESLGVIRKVDEPTPWCAGMVMVPKKSGEVRICVDFRKLNESVLREVHPLPKVEDTLAKLTGATTFSKLDVNCGFWQIPLAEESRHFTTFITPFGQYCFQKLPFGISSAPEHFQKQMCDILEGEEGVLCHIDDVLIFGHTPEEHDNRLQRALQKIKDAGVTLNKSKCEFKKGSITFLGHVIDANGISQDPDKMAAITEMPQPTNVTELRRFLGMMNQLSRFTPHVAELSQPLTIKRSWVWGPAQQEAFMRVKEELTKSSVLAIYDPEAQTKVSADASMYGLGAVLLQKSPEGHWKPVSYTSRAMTDIERRYAQIEKEALAVTWACDKFSNYILGKRILIGTDHKPLVPILNTKDLDTLPPRVLRFRLRMARFDYVAEHLPGKLLYTADTLSRAPVAVPGPSDHTEDARMETLVDAITSSLPAQESTLDSFATAQSEDPICPRSYRTASQVGLLGTN